MDGDIRQTKNNRQGNTVCTHGIQDRTWKRKHYNEPRGGITIQNIVIAICGYKGSGKTLMMIILLYLETMCGKKVLVNMKNLNFETELIKPQQLISLSKELIGCTIGIDEIQSLADCRKSHSHQNINIANFILQSRHRGVNVIFTTQFISQAEKRIRENCDIKIVARNLYIDSDNDGINDIFEYTIIDVRTDEVKTIQIYGKPFFQFYDDGEIIDIFEEEKKHGKTKRKI